LNRPHKALLAGTASLQQRLGAGMACKRDLLTRYPSFERRNEE
jgi:hypothetical protein